MKNVDNKKKTILIIIMSLVAISLLFVLIFLGNSEKEDSHNNGDEKTQDTTTTKNYRKSIVNFIKDNIGINWEYDESKLIIDNEYNVQIVLENVDHYGLCAEASSKVVKNLNKKNNETNEKIKSLSFVCRLDGNVFAQAKVIDYRNGNKIEIYNSNNEFVTDNIDDVIAQYVKEYKKNCKKYTYKEIFRNSEDYVGKYAKFTGEVTQVLDADEQYYQIMMSVTYDSYWESYDDSIVVFLEKTGFKGRVLEDDIITVYGQMLELYSYETVLGDTNTLPSLYGVYADLVK